MDKKTKNELNAEIQKLNNIITKLIDDNKNLGLRVIELKQTITKLKQQIKNERINTKKANLSKF